MMTFTHGNKSFSLGPSTGFTPSFGKIVETATEESSKINDNNDSTSKFLNIDGRLHSLVKNPTKKYRQDDPLVKGGYANKL